MLVGFNLITLSNLRDVKESKSTWPRDRLSELPESLIFHIFWLLPMRDVVRTTILFKHWNNLWTTTPFLNFGYDDTRDDPDAFREFVNHALTSWEGIRIQKFKIDFQCMVGNPGYRDCDSWVYFALRKNVQELYVHNPRFPEAYSVPKNLFSCSSLKVLSLVDCRVEIHGNVAWMSVDAINQVLRGSPRLEVFILTLVDYCENLSIRSSRLKGLWINNEAMHWEPGRDRELRIWTPNLETLQVLGVPYSKCWMMDVSSLTHATLAFYIHSHQQADGRDLLL